MRRAFLDAIREAPDDDAPRLVFADWLEDNGEPERAEFIRAQVRGEEGSERHPLLRMPEYAGISWGRPHRGFVDAVIAKTARHFLQLGDEIMGLAPITRLRLRRIDESFGLLAGSRLLAGLRELGLGNGTGLGWPDVQRLAESPHSSNLRSLLIHQEPVGNYALQAIARSVPLGNLRELFASGIGANDNGVSELVSGRSRCLETLDLRDNRITGEGAAALARWSKGPRTLWLVNNPIGDAGAKAFAQSSPPALRSLDLSHCGIGDEGVRALAETFLSLQLEEIGLRGNTLRQESWELLRARFGEKLVK